MKKPTVSVVVITYNSSKFILETLESVSKQTYKNVELIISDDNSNDETIDLCKKWISQNKHSFVRVELVMTQRNTGITGNCNRGISASKGDWIKLIAGDDSLSDTCLECFVNKVQHNPNIRIIFSDIQINGVTLEIDDYRKKFYELDVKEQYKFLLKINFLNAPASFINREVFSSIGLFDERFPMMEDYPFYIKALRNNYKIYHINQALVNYRVHDENISKNGTINKRYNDTLLAFFRLEYFALLRKERMYFYYFHYWFEYILMLLVRTGIIKKWSVYKPILYWLTPYYTMKRIKRIISN